MPIIKSAIKRMKQTIKRNERNIGIKKDIKTANKAFAAKPTADTASKAQSELDKAVKKGLIKKGTANRRKAAIARTAKEAGVKPATAKKAAAKTTTAKPVAKKAPATKAAPKKAVAAKPAAKPVAKKAPAKKPAAKKTTK